MELVGRAVEKTFHGLGTFSGIVDSYNSSSGFYTILYEDGESEEMDTAGVKSILQGPEELFPVQIQKQRRGRGPKKRRRGAVRSAYSGNPPDTEMRESGRGETQLGNGSSDSWCSGILEKGGGCFGNLKGNGSVEAAEGAEGLSRLEEGSVGREVSEIVEKGSGYFGNSEESASADGNMKGNASSVVEETRMRADGFDGNLVENASPAAVHEPQMKVSDLEGGFRGNSSFGGIKKIRIEGSGISWDSKENASRGVEQIQIEESGNSVEKAARVAVDEPQMKVSVLEGGFRGNTLFGGVEKNRIEGSGISWDLKENASRGVEQIQIKESGNALFGAVGDTEMIGGSFDGKLKESDISGVDGGTRMDSICFSKDLKENASSGAVEDAEVKSGGLGGDLKGNTFSGVVEKTETRCHGFSEDLKDNTSFRSVEGPEMKGGGLIGNLKEKAFSGFVEKTQSEGSGFGGGLKKSAPLGAVEDMQEKGSGSDGDLKGDVSSGFVEDTQTKDSSFDEFQTKESNIQSLDMEGHGRRKKRRLSEQLKSTPEMALRRSARRATATLSSSPDPILGVEELPAGNTVSAGICVGLDQIKTEELNNPPSKLELPPSSKNLTIDELPILDFFSVYACLRSFSTVLFLSPFSLEAFVAALKCNFANSLIDSIHMSILQTLKLHLDFLSNEGSESASDCLRSINWGLLDLITWPVYLVEYLIFRGSGLKSGFELRHLKLLNGEYYKQLPSVKLEILRCLCDDVVEVEAIRLELNRRTLSSELETDTDRNVNIENYSKRMDSVDDLGSSCLTQEVVDGSVDPNSDECCLCKMDGSLICCDGCPAAYHSRCVGMAKDLLPEGDWYCPECMVDKHDGWIKSSKPLQGAELLGIDPHGRLYFATGGYLLVSGSGDAESSYYYYNRNDLSIVIEALKSSDTSYGSIITAISTHWGPPVHCTEAKGHSDSGPQTVPTGLEMDSETCITNLLSPSPPHSKQEMVKGGEVVDERKSKEISVTCEDLDLQNCKASEPIRRLDSVSAIQLMEIASPFASSEGSAEMSQATACIPVLARETGAEQSLKSNIANSIEIKGPEEIHPAPTALVINPSKGSTSQTQLEPVCYINYYSFGQMASSVAEELTSKSSNCIKDDSKKPAEEIISAQLKAISKKSTNFSWSSIHKLHLEAEKEKCGWCFSCKNPSDRDCLFNTTETKVSDGPKVGAVGLRSKRNWKSHLISVKHHILSIEDRLRGLLSGPWEKPHHSKQWRKNILKAPDVASVKPLLLTLELNLRRVALSTEWLKQVDSAVTVGSASYVLTISDPVLSKHGGGRKLARKNNSVTTSNLTSTVVGIYWWRGGRLSRQVFHWKVLPQSLAFKGGRQAGCRKIPGVLYPDGSEFSKRCKCIAWRAAVERSICVAQLAYQVRDLELNIKWNDLVNTQLFPQLAKESKKLARPLKKVTIRRKCIEGTEVKYLLDFGKRKTIPNTVTKHGVMLEEPSSEKKKFWLSESYVPLKLLKAYEEKKQARIISKESPTLLPDEGSKIKKPPRQKGLSHLFSRAEKVEEYRCGHCNKDVIVREAVNCQFCKGFFHKKHTRLCKGATNSNRTYACYKCQDKKNLKIKTKSPKVKTEGSKVAARSLKVLQADGSNVTTKSLKVKLGGNEVTTESLEVQAESRKITTKSHKKQLKRSKIMDKNSRAQSGRLKITTNSCRVQVERTKITCSSSKETTKNNKVRLEMIKIPEVRRSQRSVKKVSYMLDPMQSTKRAGPKKGKKVQIKRKTSKKSKNGIGRCKGKRTRAFHAYWLKGVLWTRKSCDERGIQFRESKVLLPSQQSKDTFQQPACGLCHEGYDLRFTYIACEICEEWFHGDAFGLTMKNTNNLLGFKCHNCLKRSPPVCPHLRDAQLHNEKHDEARIESIKDLSEDDKHPCQINGDRSPSKDDYLGSYDSEGPVCKKQRIDTVPDSNKVVMLEE
ncbi:DDT domain-containing protein PTM [Magnolia sinica]|uniref:DDT domain-containing protein PTM n=1 Tax=Magnolia sinica TaxID=86752 RepID=UPI0026585497|nr:DDT domain-containing protein PTM [Magnolia sinica]XP_058107147.1 DDT domain-containing protein PTM [Magnolia sinica]